MRANTSSRSTLADRVVSAIRDGIIDGELSPGSRLVDTELAQQLDTSRPTVRDAFRRVEHKGMVVNYPYRGYFVTEVRPSQVFELLELRGLLEGRAAAAATQLDSAKIENLYRIADSIARFDYQHDVQTIRQIDIEFHNCIIETSGKQLIGEYWSLLNARLAILNSLSRDLLKVDSQDSSRRHREYVDELRTGDPVRAAAAAEGH